MKVAEKTGSIYEYRSVSRRAPERAGSTLHE